MKLPTRLNNSPLVDALFELRFDGEEAFVDVASGILFSKLGSRPKITRLSSAELPRVFREKDPNLRYSPIVRIDFDDYIIGLGDHSLQINCKIPYKGWQAFHGFITDVLGILEELSIIDEVVRYSLKYTDLIETNGNVDEQINLTSLSVSFGQQNISSINNIWFRSEIKQKEFVHIITIATSAEARIKGKDINKHGIIVETDTIRENFKQSFSEWVATTSDSLNDIHELNKKMFFQCLKEQTIKDMEPSYE